MHCRRPARPANAFGKKIEHFEAAVALNFAYYDFVKTHGAIRMGHAETAVRVSIVADAKKTKKRFCEKRGIFIALSKRTVLGQCVNNDSNNCDSGICGNCVGVNSTESSDVRKHFKATSRRRSTNECRKRSWFHSNMERRK